MTQLGAMLSDRRWRTAIRHGENVREVAVNCHIQGDPCSPVLTFISGLPLPPHTTTMFNNSAGFQFHGGNFYNISGNVHLQTHQHLTIQGHNPQEAALQLPTGSPIVLDDGPAEASCHGLSGIARNRPRPRPAPYGAFKFASKLCYVSYPQICPFALGQYPRPRAP